MENRYLKILLISQGSLFHIVLYCLPGVPSVHVLETKYQDVNRLSVFISLLFIQSSRRLFYFLNVITRSL